MDGRTRCSTIGSWQLTATSDDHKAGWSGFPVRCVSFYLFCNVKQSKKFLNLDMYPDCPKNLIIVPKKFSRQLSHNFLSNTAKNNGGGSN